MGVKVNSRFLEGFGHLVTFHPTGVIGRYQVQPAPASPAM